jgi:hypothetical protein
MSTESYLGVERKCQAIAHCGALSQSISIPVISIGRPDNTIIMYCDLCMIHICGSCSKRIMKTIHIGDQQIRVWQLCCPRCGWLLGDRSSVVQAVFSNSRGILGYVDTVHGRLTFGQSDRQHSLQIDIVEEYDQHRQYSLTLLNRAKNQLSIDGTIMIVDKAIGESPNDILALFFKSMLCAKAKYHLAGQNAWDTMIEQDEGIEAFSPINLLNIKKEEYKKPEKNIHRYMSFLQKAEKNYIQRRTDTFNPELASFDNLVQSYEQHEISFADYIQALFEDIEQPTPIRDFLRALRYENSLDFSAFEADQSQLIQILISKMDKDEIQVLIAKVMSFRLGSISKTDFYNDLNILTKRYNIDLSIFPTFSDYMQYVNLTGKLDQGALLDVVWIATQQKYKLLTRSTEENDLINYIVRIRLLQWLFNYLSGNVITSRISGTYASNPNAVQELIEMVNKPNKQKIPFWKRLFGRN